MTPRESLLTDSFLDAPLIVDGFKLRPFTAGSITTCRKMGLSLFMGDEGEEASANLTPRERNRQAIAFAWTHAAPLGEVLRHVRNGTWEDAIDLFEYSISLDSLPKILAEIRRVAEQSGEAAVDVVERSGSTGGEKPPGN